MDPFTDANGNGIWDEGESFVDLEGPPDGTERAWAAVHLETDGAMRDGYADGRWTPARWTRDVSQERGLASPGTQWRIESRGMVFRRPRGDLRLGQGPNRLLGAATLVTESRRVVIHPPAAATLCAPSPGSVVLGDRVRIRADALCVAFGASTGTMGTTATTELLAPSSQAVVPGYAAGVTDVFGMDWAQLKALADVATERRAGVPLAVKDYHLVVLERDVTYDSEVPLSGLGVLIVRGDLVIAAGSSSFFNGLIYVDGDITINGPAYVRGAIVATGRVTIQGGTGDYVELEYDSPTVSRFLADMGSYRPTCAAYTPDRDLVDTASAVLDEGFEFAGSNVLTQSPYPVPDASSWESSWQGWGDHDEDCEYRHR